MNSSRTSHFFMTEQNRIKVDLTITLSYSRSIGWRDSRYERKATIDSIVEKNMSCELFNLTREIHPLSTSLRFNQV